MKILKTNLSSRGGYGFCGGNTLLGALLTANRRFGRRGRVVLEDHLKRTATYRQFFLQMVALSRFLERKIGREEQRVGILLPNVVPALSAFWAVQTLGRVAAVLNYASGIGPVQSACRAAEIRTILSSKQFIEAVKLKAGAEALEGAGVQILYLEDVRDEIKIGDKAYAFCASFFPRLFLWRKSAARRPEDPAVLLFTSGSEGTPKGVVLSSNNILSNHAQILERVSLSPQDSLFNCLPLFHAFGLTVGALLPLLQGMRVVFYPSPLHYHAVPEAVRRAKTNFFVGTDTFLRGYARFASREDFASVEHLYAGAEKVRDETRRLWREKFGIDLLEGYGVTEASPVLALMPSGCRREGAAGRLLPGIETRVTPEEGLEKGGRLWVKGPNVMLGYMTEEKPGVLQVLKEGWHDTGDIVTIDPEGFVNIVGRAKRFAKIGGEKISLTFIEGIIAAAFPDSHQAVVSVPDPAHGEALVLLTNDPGLTFEKVLKVFRDQGVKELLVPRRLILLEEWPVLVSGKIDYARAQKIAQEQDRL